MEEKCESGERPLELRPLLLLATRARSPRSTPLLTRADGLMVTRPRKEFEGGEQEKSAAGV